MRLGLVMGGGGIVGIAWETGVLAALKDECGLDPTSAAVVMGSSAGSVIGAQAALGHDLDELVAVQRRAPSSSNANRPAPDFSAGPQAEIMQLMSSGRDDVGARIGALAQHAETALSEDAFVDSFRGMLRSDEWPAVDLRVTSCDCDTGQGVVWSREDGIELVRAVASSCAIPGFFPTVAFGGRRFMDGPRGKGHTARVLSEARVDVTLFIGPNAALGPFARMMDAELSLVRDAGIELVTITGGEQLAAIGMNLMDVSRRADGVEAGLKDGLAASADVSRLLAAAT